MSNVVKFYPANAADDPDNVLELAQGEYEDVLILGYDKDGEMIAAASTGFEDAGAILWLIEQFKLNLLDGAYSE